MDKILDPSIKAITVRNEETDEILAVISDEKIMALPELSVKLTLNLKKR